MMDALCVARDVAEAEGKDVRAARAAVEELRESIAACGYVLTFDPTLPGHVVLPRPA